MTTVNSNSEATSSAQSDLKFVQHFTKQLYLQQTKTEIETQLAQHEGKLRKMIEKQLKNGTTVQSKNNIALMENAISNTKKSLEKISQKIQKHIMKMLQAAPASTHATSSTADLLPKNTR